MKKRSLSFWFSLLAIFTIVLSSCAAAAPGEDKSIFPVSEEPGVSMPAPEGERALVLDAAGIGGGSENSFTSPGADRLVIKTANLSIVVTAPVERMNEIAAMAEGMGGFVVSSSVFQNYLGDGSEAPGAYITIRVPSELFQQALEEIRAGAFDVPTDNQYGQDVTAEFTDLQSRLRNLEEAEVLLRQIMEEATDTEDVLSAFTQLNYITEQIEVLKGQIKYYEESAALSAISVELIANQSAQPITVDPWNIGAVAKQAIEALIRALQSFAEALVWFALYALPVILVIGVPVLLVVWGLRRWFAKRSLPKSRRK